MEHNIYMKTGEFAELVGVLYRRSPDTFLEMFVEREKYIDEQIARLNPKMRRIYIKRLATSLRNSMLQERMVNISSTMQLTIL